ncbi:unnamed protein product [Schistosoma curassoni]|nr:unnamed protein product [Schistosoma curassoni]
MKDFCTKRTVQIILYCFLCGNNCYLLAPLLGLNSTKFTNWANYCHEYSLLTASVSPTAYRNGDFCIIHFRKAGYGCCGCSSTFIHVHGLSYRFYIQHEGKLVENFLSTSLFVYLWCPFVPVEFW